MTLKFSNVRAVVKIRVLQNFINDQAACSGSCADEHSTVRRYRYNVTSDFSDSLTDGLSVFQASDSVLAEVDETPRQATDSVNGSGDKLTVKNPTHKKLCRVSALNDQRPLLTDNHKRKHSSASNKLAM